jgi:hypothetical protein
MNEEEWLECTDPEPMLRILRHRATERKLRLFACASCRRIWHLLDERNHRALEVAERYADGVATLDELLRAALALLRGRRGRKGGVRRPVRHTVDPDGPTFTDAGWRFVWDSEVREHSQLLRDLVGNPFRPVALDPSLRTAELVAIAQAAYDDRTFPAGTLDPARLAVLADALEDAGCHNAEILGHLRGEGPHLRGCWALDLILGKQ